MLSMIAHILHLVPIAIFARKARAILDLGCGETGSPIRFFITKGQILDGIDLSSTSIAHLQKKSHQQYRSVHRADVRQLTPDVLDGYDLVTAFDLLEHLPKADATALLERLEASGRQILILTPNGFIPQPPAPDNPHQEHLSGWTAAEFRQRGYRVYGIYGPRPWRTNHGALTYRPRLLWGILSLLSSPFYLWLPERSFSLLAIYSNSPPTCMPE